MEIELKGCPHCGSKAKFVDSPGNMRAFPTLSIVCENKDCFGNMTVAYDEFSRPDMDASKRKMADCWNKRTG